jgi:hypothetical protein
MQRPPATATAHQEDGRLQPLAVQKVGFGSGRDEELNAVRDHHPRGQRAAAPFTLQLRF